MPQGSRRYNYAAQFGTDVDVLLHNVRCMLLDGRYILTAEVGAFEDAFAAYTQASFARGVNSGTDAIIITLLALWNRCRAVIAASYREQLAGLPLSPQRIDAGETHVYHLFQLRTARRDELLAHLQRNRVDAIVRYPTPIHLQPAFEQWGWRRGQFPVAERLADELLCLPIRPDMGQSSTTSVSRFAGSSTALQRRIEQVRHAWKR